MRDSQRSRVYASEWPAVSGGNYDRSESVSRSTLAQFLADSTRRLGMTPVQLRITRVQGHGTASGISVPRWNQTLNYAVHELTHAYLQQKQPSINHAHDKVFTGARLAITHILLGYDKTQELAKRYLANGVTVDTDAYVTIYKRLE